MPTTRSKRSPRGGWRAAAGVIVLMAVMLVVLFSRGAAGPGRPVAAGASGVSRPVRQPVAHVVPRRDLPAVAPAEPVVHTVVAVTPRVGTPATTPATSATIVTQVSVPNPDACAVALAYLAGQAAPGFAHFCRPGSLQTALGASAGYTCVPGPGFACPDGTAEIIIADPSCPASYENEASNSFWDFSQVSGVIGPGAVQDGRSWDLFGTCPPGPAT
jgi:hypothetical protein